MANDEKKGGDPAADIVSIGPQLPNGDVTFIRTRQDEAGVSIVGGTATLHPTDKMSESEGEHLRLKHIADNHFEVTESLRSGGPAKVNSTVYRSNWETIFGGQQTVGQA